MRLRAFRVYIHYDNCSSFCLGALFELECRQSSWWWCSVTICSIWFPCDSSTLLCKSLSDSSAMTQGRDRRVIGYWCHLLLLFLVQMIIIVLHFQQCIALWRSARLSGISSLHRKDWSSVDGFPRCFPYSFANIGLNTLAKVFAPSQ